MSQRTFRRCPAAGLCWALIVLVTIGWFNAPNAMAQGGQEMVPDPIRTSELMRYADRLGLSPQQKLALEPLHDTYLEQYRSLRDREIKELIELMMGLESSIPSRDQFNKFINKLEQVNQRIVNVDNSLFTRMQSMLSEHQLANIHRVQMSRERTRYVNSGLTQMILMGSRPVDLSTLAARLDLSADQLAEIDPLLAQYETSLTQHMRKLYQTMPDVFKSFFDAIESMGLAGADEDDHEKMQQLQQEMQQIMMRVMQQAFERSRELRSLNARSYRSISASLPSDVQRLFRAQYFASLDPGSAWQANLLTAWTHAPSRLPDLPDDKKQKLAELIVAFNQQADPLIDDQIRDIESREPMMPWGGWDQDAWQREQDRAKDFNQKLQLLVSQCEPQARELLGDAQFTRIQTNAQQFFSNDGDTDFNPADAVAVEDVPALKVENTETQENVVGGIASPDYLIPRLINSTDLRDYARILKLNDDQWPVLLNLHDDYVARVQTVDAAEFKLLRESAQSQWKYDEETGITTPPTRDDIERLYGHRAKATAALRRADTEFFDTITLALLNPDDKEQQKRLQRARWSRQRQWCNATSTLTWMYDSSEGAVDITEIIRTARFDDQTLASIDDLIYEYERQLTAAMLTLFDRMTDFQKASEHWTAEWQRVYALDPNSAADLSTRYQALIGDSQTRLTEASKVVSQINLSTMKKLDDTLEANSLARLRRAYNAKAFPDIYNDSRSPETALERALELQDLTTDQRHRLSELAATFRPAYEASCDRLADIRRESQRPNWSATTDRDEIRQWQENHQRQQHAEFERTELMARAVSRLTIILTPEQIRHIGGLPKVDLNKTHGMGW